MALTCSSRKIRCPTIERQLKPTNIKRWEKHAFGRVVGLKVVISEAHGEVASKVVMSGAYWGHVMGYLIIWGEK